MIVSFEQMLEKAKQGEPMVLAGAAAQDADTIKDYLNTMLDEQ